MNLYLAGESPARLATFSFSSQVDSQDAASSAFKYIETKCLLVVDGNATIHNACNRLGVQKSYVGYTRNDNCKKAVVTVLWAVEPWIIVSKRQTITTDIRISNRHLFLLSFMADCYKPTAISIQSRRAFKVSILTCHGPRIGSRARSTT